VKLSFTLGLIFAQLTLVDLTDQQPETSLTIFLRIHI